MNKPKESALRKYQAAKFALIEMHLYLDTHPEDLAMLSAYKKYEAKCAVLKNEYEDMYGAIQWLDAPGVEWIKNPWPWDSEVCD